MKIIDRLLEYLNYQGIKPTAFEKKIGLSNGYLGKQKRRNADIGESLLLKIIANCPSLSVNWLLFGSGHMFINGEPDKVFTDKDDTIYKALNKALEERIIEKDARIAELNETIAMQQDFINHLKNTTDTNTKQQLSDSTEKKPKSTHQP